MSIGYFLITVTNTITTGILEEKRLVWVGGYRAEIAGSGQRAAGRVAGASGSRHSGWSSQQKAHILNCSYDIQASHVISIRS